MNIIIGIFTIFSQISLYADHNIENQIIILTGVSEDAYDVAITKEVLNRAGYNYVFKGSPWSRCLQSMKDGTADILPNVFIKNERKEYLYYTAEPFFNFKQFIYVRKDSPINYTGNILDLLSYVNGTRIGISYGKDFDLITSDDSFLIEPVSTAIQNAKKLVLGRIDLFIENPMNLIWALQQEGEMELLDKIERIPISVNTQQSFITISKRSKYTEDLLKLMDEYLKEIKEDGTYQMILQEYFGNYELD